MRLILWTLLPGLVASRVIQSSQAATNESIPNRVESLFKRVDDDAADFSWIRRWAAIGDSFTAGIGSGRQLGSLWHLDQSWRCSRFDRSYPMVLNTAFGPAVENFQFPACSGALTGGIYEQANKLQGDLDLVILTAGGNDLCLVDLLKACVLLAYDGEEACTTAVNKARDNINTIIKPNIKAILDALNPKMKKDSIVVYNGYAQFFNTDEEDNCAKNQDWGWVRYKPTWWLKAPLPLTQERRKLFNGLVVGINDAIKDVVNEVAKSGKYNYWIGMADWDKWGYEGVRGQFCDPQGEGYYPEPKQPDLQFFKADTHIYPENMELKRRYEAGELDEEDAEELRKYDALAVRRVYDSILFRTPSPGAAVLHALNPRDAPAPPGCPSDDGLKLPLGIGLPDSWGKVFHPNEKGHVTIASYATEKMMQLRAQRLGLNPSCSVTVDEFRCHGKDDGSRGYASGARMNENYRDFCENIDVPSHEIGWHREKTYHEGTPDEHTIKLQLTTKAGDFNKGECLDSFYRITNGCDDNGDINPMWWKGGGSYRRGERTYSIDIKRTNRPWPPPKAAYGDCKGQYKGVLSSFFLHGGAWATDDTGASLKKAVGNCIGSTPSSWKFWYYDAPDDQGKEWSASFNTPIWVNARCFDNDKVQKGAGGWTNGCSGTG